MDLYFRSLFIYWLLKLHSLHPKIFRGIFMHQHVFTLQSTLVITFVTIKHFALCLISMYPKVVYEAAHKFGLKTRFIAFESLMNLLFMSDVITTILTFKHFNIWWISMYQQMLMFSHIASVITFVCFLLGEICVLPLNMSLKFILYFGLVRTIFTLVYFHFWGIFV